MKTAEELCKRTLERDKDKMVRDFPLIGKEDVQNEGENERHKNKMKKRKKLRIWDPAWGNQMRILILGDSNLIVNWMNGIWKINNQKFRAMVQKTQNMMDKTDMRPVGDLDMFQHIYRD